MSVTLTAATRTLRRWVFVHKWTSLICTLFMLLLCITGLPLIFHHEIDDILHSEVKPAEVLPGTRHGRPRPGPRQCPGKVNRGRYRIF